MDHAIVKHKLERTENESSTYSLAIGQWFWVRIRDGEDKISDKLGCITRIGSNYVRFNFICEGEYGSESSVRVHFDNFDELCRFEPDAGSIIAVNVDDHRREAQRLMGEVQEITRRLGISPRHVLADGGAETQALALRGSREPIDKYKTALIKAQKDTLPELFKAIKIENHAMGAWMKAPLLAMKAEAKALEPAIEIIEARIFNVELYAGLIEEVVQIAKGNPAPLSEPIHLFQRRAYMDEECLAQYQTGGMEFKDIKAFDRWLIRRDNRNRLLPFSRCIVAFQVRRNEKEREFSSIAAFIHFVLSGFADADKWTYLYLRNGDQVFRLGTGIEFGSQLFPDIEHSNLTGQTLYADVSWLGASGYIADDKIITETEYRTRVKAEREAKEKHEREQEIEKKQKGKDYHHWSYFPSFRVKDFHKWSPESIYYDDISAAVKKQIDAHNRLVLILQGLLDRSPVFHPHPPWQLWTGEGFSQAINLIYDDSRSLVAGDKPNFEAYRARLNASLKVGSITVGQDDFWQRVEARRENERMHRNWRTRDYRDKTRYKPDGNPGPGMLAKVVRFSNSRGCSYEWYRERAYRRYDYGKDNPLRCHLTVPTGNLLNASEYQPGDFHQFFDDPRTRAEYLKWAPLMLEAEEWHAGNRKVGSER